MTFCFVCIYEVFLLRCQLLGLNLMCLLSQNRVAEFHTELERLPSKELNDIYIKTPISLEQYIMEGSYNKVLLLKENVPAESFGFFFDILLVTVRNEIASCLEKVGSNKVFFTTHVFKKVKLFHWVFFNCLLLGIQGNQLQGCRQDAESTRI